MVGYQVGFAQLHLFSHSFFFFFLHVRTRRENEFELVTPTSLGVMLADQATSWRSIPLLTWQSETFLSSSLFSFFLIF